MRYLLVFLSICFFFINQKTAYEMRISEWSSAVCSSDLVKDYDVEIRNLQKAAKLIPARTEGGYHEVVLENGASLKGRTVILSTGARWRQMGVPGEEEYRNKGVAYCPHCDGPLFKGKRVAEIGRASCRERVCQYV